MAKKDSLKKNKDEIVWNLINSGMAGLLIFLGAFLNGGVTWTGIISALIASLIIAVTKFRDYWSKEENEYTSKLFLFVK